MPLAFKPLSDKLRAQSYSRTDTAMPTGNALYPTVGRGEGHGGLLNVPFHLECIVVAGKKHRIGS